jgi:ADP-ribose pyrophosphatase YjhB (NUDIX family)
MRPKDVANNLFSYHLDGLVKDGAIMKSHRGVYGLTAEGLKLVGALSTETQKHQDSLKTVIMVYAVNDHKEIALFRWSRQPYIGYSTLPHDRFAFGASVESAVQRATKEKLGKATNATYIKTLIVAIENEGTPISHMNALVFKVAAESITLPYIGRNGEAYWAKLESDKTQMRGIRTLIDAINSSDSIVEVTLEY